MFHRYMLCILALAACALSPCHAGEDKDPAAILDKAIKAHGGLDLLTKYKAYSWKATGHMQATGVKQLYEADYVFQLPDKLRFDMTMELGDMKLKLTVVSDGTTAWEAAEGKVRE